LLTKLAVNNNKLSEDQAEMLFNSININKLSLDEIMTKKEDVDFLTTTMSMEDIITHTQKNRHTRYPLLENGDIV
jgi:CBS domain containing-hemolysin-like protein